MLRRYLHGPGPDEPFVWYEGADLTVRRRLLVDRQGSIVSVSDNAGVILAIDSYDPWGIPGAANIGRFQYTGQAWLPELGLYYYKARIYSPTLGRFMQTDPIGYDDQINLYAYVGKDPVNRTDPTGTTRTLVGVVERGPACCKARTPHILLLKQGRERTLQCDSRRSIARRRGRGTESPGVRKGPA